MAQKSAAPALSVSKETLEQIAKEVSDIDVRIAAGSGSGEKAKSALKDSLFKETIESFSPVLDEFTEKMKGLDDKAFVGIVAALEDAIEVDFSKRVDSTISAILEQQVNATAAEIEQLKEQRKQKAVDFEGLKTVLQNILKIDVSDVELPKAKRGAPKGSGTGTTRVRTKGKIDFFVKPKGETEWKPVAKDLNSFGSVAFNYGTDENGNHMKSAELVKFVEDAGINWKEKDKWSVTLPNGNSIGGRRVKPAEEKTEETPAETPEASPEPAAATA